MPVDQTWFETPHWQERELEVDEHVAAGRAEVHDDGDALLAYIAGLPDES